VEQRDCIGRLHCSFEDQVTVMLYVEHSGSCCGPVEASRVGICLEKERSELTCAPSINCIVRRLVDCAVFLRKSEQICAGFIKEM